MVLAFYDAHPLWLWLAVAAALLAIEVATGTGWLLWPAASAAVVGLIALVTRRLGLEGEVVVFAILTIVSTLAARKLLPQRALQSGPDINDRAGDLAGKTGRVVGTFAAGHGRVLVDGAEWVAELEGDAPGSDGAVEVLGVVNGAKLRVRAL